jgi:hypothetical protein
MLKLLFRLVYTLVIFVEALILTRIVLILMGADTANTFASWVFSISDIFISPFNGLVASELVIDKYTLPLTPLVALVFYIIGAFMLSELIKAFSRD